MLKIGWATRDITPTRPIILLGQMHSRIAHKARDPITVTAWAVEDVVFVSCDILAIFDPLKKAVHAEVKRRVPDLATDNLILFATHTHESFLFDEGVYAHPGGAVMTTTECTAFVTEGIVSAIAEAWQKRAPHPLARAFGHAVVGHNRYAVYADETGSMYGSTDRPDFRVIEGYEDHGVDMLFTWDDAGKLAVVALAIPCPSQVDENIDEISADYWHEVRVELRRRFGPQVHVVAICAPAGDQSPHFMLYGKQEEEMRQRRGVSERQEIGIRVADAVERALACTKPGNGETPVFRHLVREIQLTPFQVTKRDIPWAQGKLDEWIGIGGDPDSWWPKRLREVIDAAHGRFTFKPVTVRIHAVRLGDVGLATNPFELFLDYSLRIKARSPAGQTVLTQLTNGAGSYLASERGVQAGSYGATPSSCPVGPEGGRELVEETLRMLNELFPK